MALLFHSNHSAWNSRPPLGGRLGCETRFSGDAIVEHRRPAAVSS